MRIPAALCAIHNFICTHDADNVNESLFGPDLHDDTPDDHDHITSAAAAEELDHPSARRDFIAQQMWDDYICI